MAKIRDFTVTEYGSNTLTWVPEMPEHSSGDLLLVFIGKDGNSGFTGTPGGWSAQQTQASAGAYIAIYSKVATSGAESFSITLSTTDTGVIIVAAVQDVYTGGEVNVSGKLGSDDSTIPFAGVSGISTTQDDCLVFHICGGDSGLSPTAYAPLVNLYCGDATNGSLGVAYTYQKTAGSIPQVDWFGRGNDDTRTMLIAVRSNASGKRQGYSDLTISSGQVLRPLVGLSTMQSDSWPTSLTFGMLGDDWNTAYIYNAPSTYTDILSALNDATTADVTFPTAVGDMVYFGADEKFESIAINVTTAGLGVLVWEYYNGSTWVNTGITGSNNNLTSTGIAKFQLSPIAVAELSQVAVNSVTRYWLRARITTLYSTAIVAAQSRKDGRATYYLVSAASADNGTNPYCDGASNAGYTSITQLAGFEHQFGAALDMDTGIIFGTFRGALARDLAIDQALPWPFNKAAGLQVTFADASGYYSSFSVSGKGALDTNVDGRNVFAIDWNGGAIPFGLRGSIDKSAVTRQLRTSYGYLGAVAVVWSMFSLVTRIGIAGGSSSDPLTFLEMEKIVNSCIGIFPFFQRSGNAATLFVPLQFGGGDRVCVSADLNTFQFPTIYNGVEYFAWNASVNVAGIKFYPKTGDVLKFTNCVFTSVSAYRWEFDASGATDATLDFSGSSVIGATVTLQNTGTDFDSMTFIDCPSFTKNGASLINCVFDNSKIICASPAQAAQISNSSFISSGTGHALEIGGTASNITLTGLTFSGYASSNGSTGNEAIYVNIASGSMTITISGGGVPSIRTAGCSVTILTGVRTIKVAVVSVGGPVSGANVMLTAIAGGPFPYNATVTITRSGTTATVSHSSHGMATDDKILISGITDKIEDNGVHTITKIDDSSYSYATTDSGSTNYTGTIKCTFVFLKGIANQGTDSNEISMSRSIPSNQPVTGWARKSSSAPYYKQGVISGNVVSSGDSTFSPVLIEDN